MSKWYEFKVEDGTRWIDITRIISFDHQDQSWQGTVLVVEYDGTVYVKEDVTKVVSILQKYEEHQFHLQSLRD